MKAMTDNERRQLREYCGLLMREYGFEFLPTEPIMPPLYIIHKEMQRAIDANQAIATKIETASLRIHPRVFNFSHPGEAWKFQLATAVKWILLAGIIWSFIAAGIWYWSIGRDLDRARTIIASRDRVSELAKRAKKDDKGVLFIDLTEAKGDSAQRFREYVRINKKTVRIFIGN
jgi:hypothetical protein